MIRLGSLFDGIGGFPLAAELNGMTPVWASEIESFPMQVTKERFPRMAHLGDVTKINGAEIEPVDVITFGSPCQDLSVAGKREGLDGERSGLFRHAVRVISEMLVATNGHYPRFVVWENVPGALSSNKGKDFREVIESLCGLAEKSRKIPMPRSGKWTKSGLVTGGGYSVAWRVLDAQYWGVAQRRCRIYALVDLRGQCAGKILFEREGVRWHPQTGKGTQESTARIAENSAAATNGKGTQTVGTLMENCGTKLWLGNQEVFSDEYHVVQRCAAFKQGNSATAGSIGYEVEKSPTLTSGQSGTNLVPAVIYGFSGNRDCGDYLPNKTPTLRAGGADEGNGCKMSVAYSLQGNMIGRELKNGPQGDGVNKEVSFTLNTIDRHAVAYSFDSLVSNSMKSLNPHSGCRAVDIAKTIDTTYPCPSKNQGGIGVAVRRLTPLECERLQGYPDGWTDIKGASDTARYKALGNSVAIPCVDFVIGGITEVLRSVSGNA